MRLTRRRFSSATTVSASTGKMAEGASALQTVHGMHGSRFEGSGVGLNSGLAPTRIGFTGDNQSGHRCDTLSMVGAASLRTARDPGATARVVVGRPTAGIERLAASFQRVSFSTHRHDTYGIGIATAGVQCFGCRCREWTLLPGQVYILNPDEAHDGRPGTDEGFGYRIAYVEPALVQQAVGGLSLPLASSPLICIDARWRASLASSLWRTEEDMDEAETVEAITALVEVLIPAQAHMRRLPLAALDRVREAIAAQPQRPLPLAQLERVAGLDRWSLARLFRQAFGVSPTRYRTMRQLALVRALIRGSHGLAEAVVDAGFADQSHMSRKFKTAFGTTPAQWRASLSNI